MNGNEALPDPDTLFLYFLLAVGAAVIALIVVRSICWTFGWGRYSSEYLKAVSATTPGKPQNLGYVLSEAAVKIINDFRHLLALILVLIFAFALVWALVASWGKLSDLRDALQAVVSTLGGLVGSIIGYYFGESSGKAQQSRESDDEIYAEAEPNPQASSVDEAGIEAVPLPRSARPAEPSNE